MTRSYRYVGPNEIVARVTETCGGSIVDTVEELVNSLRSMDDYQNGESLTVTFVIGLDRRLRVANRRSEHVMCASGHAVLGAGEMTFLCDGKAVFVERVTNQSTGYCPEPESWQSVAHALDEIPVDRPDFFGPAFVTNLSSAATVANLSRLNSNRNKQRRARRFTSITGAPDTTKEIILEFGFPPESLNQKCWNCFRNFGSRLAQCVIGWWPLFEIVLASTSEKRWRK